jgi:serine/threonine protein kinase
MERNLDKYVILGEIGSGAQSSIFKIKNSQGNYALRVLEADDQNSIRELEILESGVPRYCMKLVHYFKGSDIHWIENPDLINLKRYENFHSKIFLVTDLYACDLEHFLKEYKEKGEYLQQHTYIKWLTQMCIAFKGLHKKGIIHRDIKPANILLSENSENADIFIADFGASIDTKIANPETDIGTPAYKAPEVVNGEYKDEIDLYSFGVTAYRMIFGEFPQHTGDKLMIPKESNKKLEYNFLTNVLNKRPDKRLPFKKLLYHPLLQQTSIDPIDIYNKYKKDLQELHATLWALKHKRINFGNLLDCTLPVPKVLTYFCIDYSIKFLDIAIEKLIQINFRKECIQEFQYELNFYKEKKKKFEKNYKEELKYPIKADSEKLMGNFISINKKPKLSLKLISKIFQKILYERDFYVADIDYLIN